MWDGHINHVFRRSFGTDQALIRKLIEVKSPALREMVVQEMNNSPERQLAFRIWAKNIMKTRRGGHDIRTLGFMTESIAQAVESRTGTPPARLLAMSGKNVLHADSVKHQNDGIALTPEDFGSFPPCWLPRCRAVGSCPSEPALHH